MVLGTSFSVATIRSYLKQPLEECTSSSRVDGIVILSSCAVLSASAFCLKLDFYYFDNLNVSQFFLGIFAFIYIVLPLSLGIWASVQPERQVLVHGLLMVVPPILTFLVVDMNNALLPQHRQELPKHEDIETAVRIDPEAKSSQLEMQSENDSKHSTRLSITGDFFQDKLLATDWIDVQEVR